MTCAFRSKKFSEKHGALLCSTIDIIHSVVYNWRAGASQLNRTTGTNFLLLASGSEPTVQRARYIYLSRAMPYRKPSTRFQINATYDISQKFTSSRRCTVATVQDEANPSSSQPAASCCVASESTEAHRDGWRQYVLAEESVLPRKQPKRKRGV